MSLNIKNDRVHALAKELARRTGRTQTGAIELALTRLVEELDRQEGGRDRRQRIETTLADMQERVRKSEVELTTDDLYDATGLPS